MRYLKARTDATFREHMYRIYITDWIAVASGAQTRYINLITNAPGNEETRTEEEVREYFKNKINETEKEER